MTSVLSARLPLAPADKAAGAPFNLTSGYTGPVKRPIEPVGRYFLAHASRALRGHTWSEYEKIEAENNVKKVDESPEDTEEEEPEDPEMLERDPKDWKNQDHYAVLGLSKYRYKANEEQIRKAHRKKVLKHHPDKKGGEKGGLDKDGFFKCIQKAYEILMDTEKRRQWDSVDKGADVPKPTSKSKGDFFELWGPVFESEARFSMKHPVPQLGNKDTPKAEVERFYSWWYKFDSWRSFEYLDEETPDDSSNRDNKRYIEKKNNNARKKKKTEDNSRLQKLVSEAIGLDPRIALFKKQEKEEKARKKWEREAGARKAAEEAKAKKEAEEKAKKEAEENAKNSKQSAKKAKEAAKNAKKKNKRAIRGSAKAVNYFGDASHTADIDADIDLLIAKFDDTQLHDVAKKVDGVKDSDAVKAAFTEVVSSLTASKKLTAGELKFFKA